LNVALEPDEALFDGVAIARSLVREFIARFFQLVRQAIGRARWVLSKRESSCKVDEGEEQTDMKRPRRRLDHGGCPDMNAGHPSAPTSARWLSIAQANDI
jgi:hypothetical protein